ncbi:hypothetical protein BDN67DRAFT_967323 [Paxillus ammoniavirescens]|nr:hypothetical protein BDN67DRAFT_967323 [Paxillus ammoniavirescens]
MFVDTLYGDSLSKSLSLVVVWDIPFYFDANHVGPSPYICPQDVTCSFTRDLWEVPPFPSESILTEETASEANSPPLHRRANRHAGHRRRNLLLARERVARVPRLKRFPSH